MNALLARAIETISFAAIFSITAFIVIPHVDRELNLLSSEQVASVSAMGASVTANPTNTLATQLRDWQDTLDARQADLQAREEASHNEASVALARDQRVLLGTILFFLLALIVTNTYTHHRDLAHERHVLRYAALPFHSPRIAHPESLLAIDLGRNKNTRL